MRFEFTLDQSDLKEKEAFHGFLDDVPWWIKSKLFSFVITVALGSVLAYFTSGMISLATFLVFVAIGTAYCFFKLMPKQFHHPRTVEIHSEHIRSFGEEMVFEISLNEISEVKETDNLFLLGKSDNYFILPKRAVPEEQFQAVRELENHGTERDAPVDLYTQTVGNEPNENCLKFILLAEDPISTFEDSLLEYKEVVDPAAEEKLKAEEKKTKSFRLMINLLLLVVLFVACAYFLQSDDLTRNEVESSFLSKIPIGRVFFGMVIFFGWMVGILFLMNWQARKANKLSMDRVFKNKSSLFPRNQIWCFSETGFGSGSEQEFAVRPWSKILKILENKSIFGIHCSDALILMVPKRIFETPEEGADFVAKIKSYQSRLSPVPVSDNPYHPPSVE